MVPTYIADLIPPLVSEISGYPLINNNIFSTPFTRTNVSTRSCIPSAIRMWNNLAECLKTNQRYHLLSIIYKPLLFKAFKYLATSHLRKDIYLYCMLEVETIVVIYIMIYSIIIFMIIPFVVGVMKQRMVNTTSFIATNTETSVTNSLKQLETFNHLPSTYYYTVMKHWKINLK